MNMTPSINVVQSETELPALEALTKLFHSLNNNGIRYCHWKSNIRLEESLQGKTDLDLLVARDDSQAFRRILIDQNIKPIVAAPGHQYPAMENYLGLDKITGAFFHLHVHYQLVLGERFVKNYHLPFDKDFLDNVYIRHGVKIPLPELEIVVLAVRTLLKYRTRDLIKDNIPIRGPGLHTSFRTEIEWLLPQTSMEKIASILNNWNNVFDDHEFIEFIQVAQSKRKSGLLLQRIKNRVKRRLGLFQRSNTLSATAIYFRELWTRRNYWRISSITKMTFPEGGQSIAIIGADGAGKSTMTRLLGEWLSWKLDVHTFYLGSKKPSRRSSFYYLVFRALRRFTSFIGEKNVLGRLLLSVRDIPLYMHHHSTGRDRYVRYVEGGKHAIGGSLVLYDRYPLDAFNMDSVDLLKMDNAKISSLAYGKKDFITNWFIRAENKYYKRFSPPTCVIVLDVSPKVSFARKPDHDPATLDKKIKGVRVLIDLIRTNYKGVKFIHINADQPFNDVVLQLKRKIWNLL